MGYNSTGIFTAGKCLNALINLEEIKGGDYSLAKKRTKLGYLQAINSPLNRSAQRQIPTQNGSKKRIVEIRWMQRAVEGQVEESLSGTCSSTDFPDFNAELFEVSHVVETKFSLNSLEFKEVCMGRTEFINEVIQLRFDAMAKKIDTVLLTEQATNFGINLATGSSASSDVTVFPAATGAPNAAALQKLMYEYEVVNEFVAPPMWIGAGNIYKFWRTLEQSCCNDAGIDMLNLSNALGYAPFIDRTVEAVLGANHFIVMEPKSVQFVPFNDYVGEDATTTGTSVSRGTITDPVTGITYDIKVMQDDCSDNWVVIMRLNYGIFFQPAEAFQADDALFGTNGILHYTAVTS